MSENFKGALTSKSYELKIYEGKHPVALGFYIVTVNEIIYVLDRTKILSRNDIITESFKQNYELLNEMTFFGDCSSDSVLGLIKHNFPEIFV